MNAATVPDGQSGRLDRTTVSLAVVDSVLLVGLIFVGQRRHGIDPITDPGASVETVIPFLIGWFVAAVLAGIYARHTTTSVSRVARVTAITWFAAANIGLVLRSSPVFEGNAVWPFNLVMTGTGLLVLVGWRVLYTAWWTAR